MGLICSFCCSCVILHAAFHDLDSFMALIVCNWVTICVDFGMQGTICPSGSAWLQYRDLSIPYAYPYDSYMVPTLGYNVVFVEGPGHYTKTPELMRGP